MVSTRNEKKRKDRPDWYKDTRPNPPVVDQALVPELDSVLQLPTISVPQHEVPLIRTPDGTLASFKTSFGATLHPNRPPFVGTQQLVSEYGILLDPRSHLLRDHREIYLDPDQGVRHDCIFYLVESVDNVRIDVYHLKPWPKYGNLYETRDRYVFMDTFPRELQDPSSFPLHPTPDDFALELRPHQKQTLSWMVQVENEKQLATVSGIEPSNLGSSSDLLNETFKQRCGVVCDNTGSGKTISMISLIKQNPCKFFYEIGPDNLINSRATLILCPPNIVSQWKQEIKRCLGEDAKVIVISSSHEVKRVRRVDVVLADAVVVPYTYINNPTYLKLVERINTQFPEMETTQDYFYRELDLYRVRYHRLILDELHEILDWKRRRADDYTEHINRIHANYRWGVTGTPPKDDVVLSNILNCVTTSQFLYEPSFIREFKFKLMKSSHPILEIPPLSEEIKYISLSRQGSSYTQLEILIYQSMQNSGRMSQKDLLMMCSHFMITNEINQILNANENEGGSRMTIDEVAEKLQDRRSKNIRDFERSISTSEKAIKKANASLKTLPKRLAASEKILMGMDSSYVPVSNPDFLANAGSLESDSDMEESDSEDDAVLTSRTRGGSRQESAEILRARKRVRKIKLRDQSLKTQLRHLEKEHLDSTASLSEAQRQFNYFKDLIDLLESDNNDCPICLETIEIEDGHVCLTKCGHVYCEDCLGKVRNRCAICRAPIDPSATIRIKPRGVEMEIDEDDDGFMGMFGSKITVLVEYVVSEISKDDTSKFILFVQFTKLAKLVAGALDSYGIPSISLTGSITKRAKGIEKFQTTGSSVLILAFESSVSGVHLACATHVLILHPFHFEDDAQALAAEKQGIARAYRAGQTRSVKVVRFVTKGTIEEVISKRRIENRLY